MATTFIFAIGGTGARVLRSLTMLMAAGTDGFDGPVCPIIIDYDKANGDKNRTVLTMKKYSAVHDLLSKGKAKLDSSFTDGKKTFFAQELKTVQGFPDWTWNFQINNNNQKFRDYISYDSIGNYSPATRDLIECLYDTSSSSEYTELDLNMQQGFQGNPNLGSVVFDQLKESREFKAIFTNEFRQGDRIVVVGSIFGGTGSSGIPQIISAIRNHNRAEIKAAPLSVVLMLPYFMIEQQDQQNISVKSRIFNSKTKAALSYYEKSGLNGMINHIYYVGDKVLTKVKPHLGADQQINNAHIVELISAMAVVHSSTNTDNGSGNKYKFNAAADIEDGIGIRELIGDTTQWGGNGFVRSILHNLIDFVVAVRYFNDEIVNAKSRMDSVQFYKELHLNFENKTLKSNEGESPIQDYCATFHDFICKNKQNSDDDGFWQWLDELSSASHGEHRLNIFNLDSDEICDFLKNIDLRSDPGFIEKCVKYNKRKPMIKYDDNFDSAMNLGLSQYRSGSKQLNNLDICTYPWIFNEMLRSSFEYIRNNSEIKLREKLQLIP